jgi:oligopeptide/dipeptide ABC transporter ATP-binding protein
MTEAERRSICGDKIALISQDALTSLNPGFSVGYQIEEMYRVHRGSSQKEARSKAIECLDRVGIPQARERIGDFPHQFSGGMRQRAMIAMALALDPDVLFADEPTTALDVTVQAQIMELLTRLQSEANMSLVLITHDLAVVAEIADRIAVMYAGRIVESGSCIEVYRGMKHPYTRALMQSIPRADQKGGRLDSIPGAPTNPKHIPPGCAFHPRCPHATDLCRTEAPSLRKVSGNHSAACHLFGES